MVITISGKRMRLLADSFTMDDAVEERSICSFTVIDKHNNLNLRKNDPVLVWDTEGFRIFGGVIERPQRIRSGDHYLWDVTCVDWHYLADKRIVRASYENMLVGDIVRDLVDKILSEEGVVIDYTEEDFSFLQGQFPATFGQTTIQTVYDGPIAEETVFNYIPVSQAMDSLAELAGYWWMIDQFKRLWFMPRTANRLNTTLTRQDMEMGSISVEDTNIKYRNRQYIRGGKDVTDLQTIERQGDGVTTAFITDYPIARVPKVEVQGGSAPREYLSTYMAARITTSPYVSIYKRDGDSFTHLPNAITSSPSLSDPTVVRFSPGDRFMAVGKAYSPYVVFFRREGDSFIPMSSLDPNVTGRVRDISFSPDGKLCAIGHDTAPFLSLYDCSGPIPIKLSTPVTLTAYVSALSFSPDGKYLVFSPNSGTPRIIVLKNVVGQWLQLPASPDALTATCDVITFSPNGQYFIAINSTNSIIRVYKMGEDTYSRLPDLPSPPGTYFKWASFSHDSRLLAIGGGNSPRYALWEREGDTFTPLPLLPDGPATDHNVTYLAFSPEGSHLALAQNTRPTGDPSIWLYKISGRVFTRLFSQPNTLPSACNSLAFSLDAGEGSSAGWSPQTVGIRGVEEGKQWYWNKGDAVISQDRGEQPLQPDERIKITYQGEFDIVVITQDNSEIVRLQDLQGTSGIVEDVSDDYNVSSLEAAFQLANAKLAKYAKIGRRLKFRSHRWGLDPGKLVNVYLPEYGLDNVEMLIESCDVEVIGGVMFYLVTCVEGELEGSWTDLFKALEAESRLPIIRQNISEQEVLLISEQFADNPLAWSENITDHTYACFVPSPTLYPSLNLYPC